ncbi:hypothetical protein GCM10011390_33320 [Aureimonas endophytica]|uniref:Uncharacterized protein n=1 Tax=Aureimonas endophytica TaxID=2027858 RepID=A0A916ZS89_9HYPH|nr:hypothetical protein [Aureimonas endophytica]GGE11529.1 hypothetical protein GCM10011390_33320 [Aureimonas endophytica]
MRNPEIAPDGTLYETTSFRTLGWIGAVCFTLGPPAFLYEWWLMFYTTAVEENPSIGPLMVIACLASFASLPLMIAGRRKRISPSPSVDPLPRMAALRRHRADPTLAPQPGHAPV